MYSIFSRNTLTRPILPASEVHKRIGPEWHARIDASRLKALPVLLFLARIFVHLHRPVYVRLVLKSDPKVSKSFTLYISNLQGWGYAQQSKGLLNDMVKISQSFAEDLPCVREVK